MPNKKTTQTPENKYTTICQSENMLILHFFLVNKISYVTSEQNN